MPDIDGMSLARAVAAGDSSSHPRFMLLTSSDAEQLDAEASQIVHGYLQKPIRAKDLLRSINRVMSSVAASTAVFVPVEKPHRLHPRAILVVEDNPINQEVMTESLEQLGYRAHVVGHGQAALEALEEKSYPVIFMDCQMPVMDGYAASREIRRREAGAHHVPIIAVNAHALGGEREKVLAAGMDDYVVKPISQATLLEALQRWWPGGAEIPESGESLSPGPHSDPGEDRDVESPGLADRAAPRPQPKADPTTRSARVLKVFLKSVPGQIEAIEVAVASGDPVQLKQAAHLLKGGCLAVGVASMASLCAQLESNPDDRSDLVEQLSNEFEVVAKRLGGVGAAATKGSSLSGTG
jgi:CheY-like chemotaxis protein/HPt (histidine-containing phosphotransfer) domain-containing protein